MKSSSNRGKPPRDSKETESTPTEQDGSESGWLDMARIRQLVRLMRDNDLTEIALQERGSRLRLRRGNAGGYTVAAPVAATQAASAATRQAEPNEPKVAETSNLLVIKSPIVGTYYSASSPEVEPFVRVGTAITPESIVCIVEAMKVFNEIPAGVGGIVREILVENGAPVDYGQPLFRVEPN